MKVNMNMRKVLLMVSLIGAMSQVNAQVAIGTNTPHASAKFQVDATDKGFLPPRVALTSLTDNTTIASPATGLMVYCTGTAGLAEGFYYWNASAWTKMSQVSNVQDLGYVVGWPSNATPPGFLLPLSGGTYNWADYPEFQTFNGTYASQFIASSNATTFTLKDINSTGRFLRGGSTAGTDQVAGTKLPVIPFAIGNAGAHVHSVDPPSTGTSSDGAHSHTLHRRGNEDSGAFDPGNGRWSEGSCSTTDRGMGSNVVPTSSNGAHTHTLDIAAFNSASNGDHTHTISGGDAETRPINTSIVWCLKVKPTSSAGNITINNVTGITSASNGLTGTPSNVKLGGSLTENTTIAKGTNTVTFSGTGTLTNEGVLYNNGKVGIGTSAPVTTLHIENNGTNGTNPADNNVPNVYLYNSNNASNSAHSIMAVRTGGASGGNPYVSWDISGVKGYSMGIQNGSVDDELIIASNWNFLMPDNNSKLMAMKTGSPDRVSIYSSGGALSTGWPAGWGGGLRTFDISCQSVYYSALVAQSDRRLKNNVTEYNQDFINKYMQLRPVNYFWNEGRNEDRGLQYGFIAQEVESVFPELVFTEDSEMKIKSMNYQAFHSMNVKMIQEQQKTIENQQSQIDALIQRLERLEKKTEEKK